MIPSTGVPLPFVSAGGSSAASMVLMFMLMQGMQEERREPLEHASYKAGFVPGKVSDKAKAALKHCSIAFPVVLGLVALYFTVFMCTEAQTVIFHSYNRRQAKLEEQNARGTIYDADGKLLTQESIVDYTRFNILGRYASLDKFILHWTAEEKKEEIRELLRSQGIDLEWMKADQGMSDVDDFDFICHVAYDQKPLTRRERAANVKKRDFLSRYSGVAREVLEALLEKYMNSGVYEIEKTEILQLDPFRKFGKPSRIAGHFGGKEGYLKAVKELENEIYKVG
jgi:hypothetical protein